MDLPSFAQLLDLINNSLALFILAASVIISAVLFLLDPIRRWRIIGFQPVVILVLFDPAEKTVLMIKEDRPGLDTAWLFPQSSMFSNDVRDSIDHCAESELGLLKRTYDIFLVQNVGALGKSIERVRELRKYQYGNLTLSLPIRGKGYLACVLKCNLSEVRDSLDLGFGISEYQIISLDEAEEILLKDRANYKSKHKVYEKILNILRKID